MFTERGRWNSRVSSSPPQRALPLLSLVHRMVVKGDKHLPLVLFRVESSLQSGCLAVRQATLCCAFERSHHGETHPNTEKDINIFPSLLGPNPRWWTGGVCVCGGLGSFSSYMLILSLRLFSSLSLFFFLFKSPVSKSCLDCFNGCSGSFPSNYLPVPDWVVLVQSALQILRRLQNSWIKS